MTKDEAMQIVEDMLLVGQKIVSNFKESEVQDLLRGAAKGGDTSWVLPDMHPWLVGEKSVLPTLVDLTMGLKQLDGQGLYNLMFIAHNLEPIFSVVAPMRLPEGRDLPEPQLAWVGEDWS